MLVSERICLYIVDAAKTARCEARERWVTERGSYYACCAQGQACKAFSRYAAQGRAERQPWEVPSFECYQRLFPAEDEPEAARIQGEVADAWEDAALTDEDETAFDEDNNLHEPIQ